MRPLGQIRYEIIVPRRYNDGSAVPDALFERYRSKLLEVFGGMTVYESVSGYSVSVSDVFRDGEPHRVIVVDANRSGDLVARAIIEFIAGEIANELDQEAVYVTASPCESFLVAGPRQRQTRVPRLAPDDFVFLFRARDGALLERCQVKQGSDFRMPEDSFLWIIAADLVHRYRLDELPISGRG